MFKSFFAAVSGDEINSKYDVETAPCATGGHRFLWKVFNAVHRKSRTPVSIFIIDKEVGRPVEARRIREGQSAHNAPSVAGPCDQAHEADPERGPTRGLSTGS